MHTYKINEKNRFIIKKADFKKKMTKKKQDLSLAFFCTLLHLILRSPILLNFLVDQRYNRALLRYGKKAIAMEL